MHIRIRNERKVEEKSGRMGKDIICLECGAKNTYEFEETIREYKGDGYHFEMLVIVPFCAQCGAPVYDEEVEKGIAQEANSKIRSQREIITRKEILEILGMYNVSQKFLSKLLGWGEITLTRYISGNYTPSLSNSNRLKELYNPYVFQMLMQNYCEGQVEEKDEKSIKKAQSKITQELGKLGETQGKIFGVVNWFLSQSSEEAPITHLALQKLLYFSQNWSSVLLDKTIFDDACQAWAHGAVYPKVYEFFKRFKYMPLPKVEETTVFDERELQVLNAVKRYYFDTYTAKSLEEICHREKPYIEARKGYLDGEICHETILKDQIISYYDSISQTYGINLTNISNIRNYLNIVLSK